MTSNLVEPMVLNTTEALNFCKRNMCVKCLNTGVLQAIFQGEDKFIIRCSNCKQDIRETDFISKTQYEKMKANEKIGDWEFRERENKKLTMEQAMKDLGF